MRRLAFAYTITYLNHTIVTQVLVIDLLSTSLLGYFVAGLPMADGLNNFVQVFNEVVILLCAWSLFLFTDYVTDPKQRHEFGQSYLYLVGFNFVVNFFILIAILAFSISKGVKDRLRRRKIKTRVNAQDS